jgi:transketolase
VTSGPQVQVPPIDVDVADEAGLLREEIVRALHACGGGHYGGSLSVLEIVLTLYRRQLRVSPAAPRHPHRDRFLLSKGHAAIALYAVLRRLGFFDAPLEGYASFGSPLEGHPDMTSLPGVDFSGGSLGQGLSVGAGMALALREAGAHVWVVVGDGECQEGQIWEAALVAAQYGLDNLHVVVDSNRYQEWGWNRRPGPDGEASVPPPVADLPRKWASFGWAVAEADGHDPAALAARFDAMRAARGAPSALVAHTVKGRGFASIEADPLRFHCATMTDAEHRALRQAP